MTVTTVACFKDKIWLGAPAGFSFTVLPATATLVAMGFAFYGLAGCDWLMVAFPLFVWQLQLENINKMEADKEPKAMCQPQTGMCATDLQHGSSQQTGPGLKGLIAAACLQ